MPNQPLFNIRIGVIKANDSENYAIMMGFVRSYHGGPMLRTNRKLVKTVDDIDTVAKSIIDELTPQIKDKLKVE